MLWGRLRKLLKMKKFLFISLLLIGVVFLSWEFLFQVRKVVGKSMEPNMGDQKTYLLDLISYRLSAPKRGEVVVYRSWGTTPTINNGKQEWSEFVGRIVGLPGEKIMFKDGAVYINGAVLTEPYLAVGTKTGIITKDDKLFPRTEMAIPTDTYFILGDNRTRSFDSRTFGPILQIQIVGRLVKYR